MDSSEIETEITALEVELVELTPQWGRIGSRIQEIQQRLRLLRTLRLREIALQKFGVDSVTGTVRPYAEVAHLVEPWLKAMTVKAEIKQLQARLPGASHDTAKQLQRRINELQNQLAAMKVNDDE